MPIFTVGAAGTTSSGYEIDNSLRFNNSSDDTLTRTQTAGNRKTYTFSVWLKKAKLDSYLNVMGTNSEGEALRIENSGALAFFLRGSGGGYLVSNDLFRDTAAWYHIVAAVDTSQATASNRVKIYVNNRQITSFSSETYPSLNAEEKINQNGETFYIGNGHAETSSREFDGYMAEAVMIDGQQLTPTSFGEVDSDTGIWKPIDVSGLTFGTNGFYLDFENSGSLGADVSGNGNNFTVNNLTAIDQSLDTPTNSYCTFMYNHPSVANFTLTEGGLKVSKSGAATFGLYGSSIMPSAGKWYWEVKFVVDGGSDRTRAGVAAYESVTGTSTIQGSFSGFEFTCSTSGRFSITENGTTTEIDGFNGYATGDIIRFALDMDNTKLYIGRNGDWFNYSSSATGGDPTSGSGWCTNSAIALAGPVTVYAGHSVGASGNSELQYNFGSPPYAISSGNSDGNGHGNFEYAVPSGYYALNTKNLAEFG